MDHAPRAKAPARALPTGRSDDEGKGGGDGVRLTSVQPYPDAFAVMVKIGGFSEVMTVHLSECVPLRSHKTALLSGNNFGNAMPRRH